MDWEAVFFLTNMDQARVTDYFSRNKRAAVGRRGRKAEGPGLAEKDAGSRETRRSSCRTIAASSKEPLKGVEEEFLRVISEAVAADPASDRQVPAAQSARAEAVKPKTPQTPRTPKRRSTDESAVFTSTTEQHSSAKKRLRIGAKEQTGDSPAPGAEKKRSTARKKLELTKLEQVSHTHTLEQVSHTHTRAG